MGLSIGLRLKLRLERIGVPQRQRVDRLDVVVAVEQDMRRIGFAAIVMGHHHRVAGRVAHRRIETERAQLGHQPFGRPAALRLEGRIGGDGLDAHQLEQSVEARRNIGAGAVEDRQDVGHGEFPKTWRARPFGSLAWTPRANQMTFGGDIRPIASGRANRMTILRRQILGSRPRLASTMRIYSSSSSRSKCLKPRNRASSVSEAAAIAVSRSALPRAVR